MKLERMEANIIVLALMALILILSIVFTNNLIQIENLELNKHVLEDCKITEQEIQEFKF